MIFSDVLWTTFDHTDTLHWKLHPSKASTVTTNPKCLNELLVFHITHNVQQLTEQDLYIHTKSYKKSCSVSIHYCIQCTVQGSTIWKPRNIFSLHCIQSGASVHTEVLGPVPPVFGLGTGISQKRVGSKKVCLKNAKRHVKVCVVSTSHLTSKNKLTTQIVIRMCRNKKLTTTWASIEPPSDLGKKSDSH